MKNTAPALVCLLLAACGGGGGGGSTGGGSTGTTPPATTASYLVAGPVVGLEASGLVVANGSDTVTVPKGGTSFVFGNKVATGASYSVAITSQPLGFQACSLTGTFPAVMAAADVTVPVICSDAPVSVSTLAGADAAAFADGTGSAARFNGIFGLALDASGNVYVGDALNSRIRKITPDGVVTTFAGSLAVGNVDGTGANASFRTPSGLAFDAAGNLYVTDAGNHNVRKITPAGVVTLLAGSGTFASRDGNGVFASFKTPSGLVVDSANNVYVGDAEAHVIRKIMPQGDVTTFAGATDFAGSADGVGGLATFNDPSGLAIDAAGNLYVADAKNNKIRKVTPGGVVTTFAGTGAAGSANGAATAATFNTPVNLSIDSEGFLYVAEAGGLIRKISPSGKVSTVAGGGTSFDTADTGAGASFKSPTSVVFDKSKTLYVADANKVRKLVRK
jgi:sugar lactone lactonase YvrE